MFDVIGARGVVRAGMGLAVALALMTSVAGQAVADEFTWTPEVDCASCHEAQAASFDAGDGDGARGDAEKAGDEAEKTEAVEANGGTEEAKKSAEKDGDAADPAETHTPLAASHGFAPCVACHTDEDGLAEAHEGVSGPKKVRRLKYTYVTTQDCLGCHQSWETVAEQTTDCAVLTDKKGRTVNPHALPEGHIDGDRPDVSCYSCHDMHAEQDLADDAANECRSCHHADVFECHTCHE